MPTEIPAVDVYSGDNLTLEYRFRDDVDAPMDVSGYTFTAQWRPSTSADRSVPFTVDQTQTAVGVIVLSMTGEQTASMRGGGVFDVQGVDGATVKTFLRGSTRWVQDVTRG